MRAGSRVRVWVLLAEESTWCLGRRSELGDVRGSRREPRLTAEQAESKTGVQKAQSGSTELKFGIFPMVGFLPGISERETPAVPVVFQPFRPIQQER